MSRVDAAEVDDPGRARDDAAAGFDVRRFDLRGRALTAGEAGPLAAAIAAGELVEADLLAPEEAAALAEELAALHRAHLPPGEDAYSQLLAGAGGAAFNWGTAAGEGAVPLDLAARPLLARVAASALALAAALRAPGEEVLLSLVPSLRRTRTFPRFFHRDSHRSVDEVAAESAAGGRPSDYRAVWDLGLEHSSDVLDVAFAPRAALLAPGGGIAPGFRRLFQLQDLDFRRLSDAAIDAVQPQMREETLPFGGSQRRLLPGRVFVWHDDHWFHSTYLRRGRRIEELVLRPRSILVVRSFAAGAHRAIPWSEAARRALAGVLGAAPARGVYGPATVRGDR